MKHIAVEISNLPEELFLDCKVYLKKDGDFTFFCEDVKVSPVLIKSFERAASPETCVYITADTLERFKSKGIQLTKVPTGMFTPKTPIEPPKNNDDDYNYADAMDDYKLAEARVAFQRSKGEAKKMFANIARDGKVDNRQADDFVRDIRFKLETNDISLILQSIDSIRNFDEYLHTHSLNVAFLNGLMGRWLNFDKNKQRELVKVGLLHDIGKLKVDKAILTKPGLLTSEEFIEIKKHPYYAYEIMLESGIQEESVILGIVQHHEKLNGTGYPNGITTHEITEYARITAISDIYDAMVTKRVYKDAHSPFVILENFAQEGYSELDINYAKTFIECMIAELKGKRVVLNDGSIARVVMVNPRNLTYPIVSVNGKVVTTSEKLYCVSMYKHHHSSDEIVKI